jgi:biotin-dependent carboxylase-like uncharacterized protein
MGDLFLVARPGAYSTIQDLGRYGYQDLGVPVSGVLDQFAARTANLLLGNPESAAVLECTVIGPTLTVLRDAVLAVTGADMEIRLNNTRLPVWSRFLARAGDTLQFRQVTKGCRMYLAVSGGFDVPVIMNSRSTCVSGGFGGLQGRPLQKGDTLAVHGGPGSTVSELTLSSDLVPAYGSQTELRVVPGPQDSLFTQQGLDTLFESVFTVSPKANRMGYRLEGPEVVRDPEAAQSIISEPSLPGNIQVPADGQPIILLVEQTVGGYTKIATVISSDLPRVAQALPGHTIRFQPVSVEEAHRALEEQEHRIQNIRNFLTAADN